MTRAVAGSGPDWSTFMDEKILDLLHDRVAIRKGFQKKWAVWDQEGGRT